MASIPKQGRELIREIEHTHTWTPTLWWLGHCGFVIKYHAMIFYVDPCLSKGPERVLPSPLLASEVGHADLILSTHAHPRHLDCASLQPMLEASPKAKLVLPKSAAFTANAAGIGYHRMTTTDSDLRVEYFKDGDYIRVYAVPSAHPGLDHTPIGGYPYLGYLIRCGGCTIYHSGDCVPYETLADRLRPYSVDVAIISIDGPNFSIDEASQLAEEVGADWLIPMHYGTFADSTPDASRFIEHMLFHRPSQRFKVFECGESWTIPED